MDTKQQVCQEMVSEKPMTHEGALELGTAAWGLGLAAIIIAVVLLVLATVQSTLTTNSAAYNAVGLAITAVASFATWFGIIAVVYAASVVLNAMGFLGGRGNGGA